MILCFDIGGTAIKIAEAFFATDIRPQGRVPIPAQDYPAFVAARQAAVDAALIRPERPAFSIAGGSIRKPGWPPWRTFLA